MANNQIRIIAGQWRGRKITFHDAEGLRPTSDRIRETLFNWLAPYIESSRCLDLFAGSGALGLEALSRGAIHVCFVDNHRLTVKNLEQNLQKLSAQQANVYLASAQQFIEEKDIHNYDIFFIDPPYASFKLEDISNILEKKLASTNKDRSCRIYYECNQAINEQTLPPNWKIEKQKKAGNVSYYLIKRELAFPI